MRKTILKCYERASSKNRCKDIKKLSQKASLFLQLLHCSLFNISLYDCILVCTIMNFLAYDQSKKIFTAILVKKTLYLNSLSVPDEENNFQML